MTTSNGPKRMQQRTRRALTALGVGIVASLPALGLAALALIRIEPDAFMPTAGSIALTAFLVVMGTAAGGGRIHAESNVALCMALGTFFLLVVGFPVFVVLEPIWWRFALGLAGPLLVAAGVAYGAPRGSNDDVTLRAWLMDPLHLVWRILLSLIGRDATVHTARAQGG